MSETPEGEAANGETAEDLTGEPRPRGSIPGTVAVFALAAPGIATVVLVAIVLGRQMAVIPEFIGMIPMMLPTAYLMGVVPGLLTGLAAVALSRRIANLWVWAVLTTLIGTVLAVFAVLAFDPTRGALSLLGTLRLAGPPSVAAFLACALACAKFRPRPA